MDRDEELIRIIAAMMAITVVIILAFRFGDPVPFECWSSDRPHLCKYKLEGVCK